MVRVTGDGWARGHPGPNLPGVDGAEVGALNPLVPYWSGVLVGVPSGMCVMGLVYDLPLTLLPVAMGVAVIGLLVTVVGALL